MTESLSKTHTPRYATQEMRVVGHNTFDGAFRQSITRIDNHMSQVYTHRSQLLKLVELNLLLKLVERCIFHSLELVAVYE